MPVRGNASGPSLQRFMYVLNSQQMRNPIETMHMLQVKDRHKALKSLNLGLERL